MMTTIQASCPGCGTVSLQPWEITLTDDEYSFRCPGCSEVVSKHADDRVIRLLLSGGVSRKTAPAARFDWPAFTRDDLLEFHELLAGDSWIDQFTVD